MNLSTVNQDELFQYLMSTPHLECTGTAREGRDTACLLGQVRGEPFNVIWVESVNMAVVAEKGTRYAREFWGEQAKQLSERLRARGWT